jgi:hypothetical protein
VPGVSTAGDRGRLGAGTAADSGCGRLATLCAMAEDKLDPIANTQMFRRFVAEPEPASPRGKGPWLVLALVGLALVLAGVVVWLAAS